MRFTLVWFSIGAHWLRRLSDVDLESLRSRGFRPRSGAQLDAMPTQERVVNDSVSYPPGFLYFARSRRSQLEDDLACRAAGSGPGIGEATRVLRANFAALTDGDISGDRGFYAGPER